MSIKTYIQKLRDEKNVSFMQLAKDIDITYANIMDLKNGRINFPTRKILNKIAKYEGRPVEEVLEDILIYLSSQISSLTNPTKVAKALSDARKEKIDSNLVSSYIN